MTTSQTIMRPPSPAALAKLYRDGMWEERKRKADEATAAFDLDALKEVATNSLGHTCNAVYHLAQGRQYRGFNQVFILTFEGNSREPIIARLNGTGYHQDDGVEPKIVSHRVASEESTTVPVAHVFAFVSDPNNPVKTRYSLQSQIIGRRLTDVWFDLTMEQMEAVVRGVARIEGETLNVTFNSIGSLLTDDQSGAIRVGHMAKNRCYSAIQIDNSGPWSSSRDFLKTLALSEISLMRDQPDSWLTRRKSFSPDEDVNDTLRYMSTWYTLLCKAFDSLNFEMFDAPSCPIILRHDDLNLSNILVAYDNPARVVGIVDWEGARCVPLWTHMIGDNFLEPNDLKRHSPEALTHLRSIRRVIHVEMQPALSLMDQPLAQALEWICEILTWPSTLRPISDLDSCIQFASEACSADEIAPFGEIFEFVSQSRDACEEDSVVPPFGAA